MKKFSVSGYMKISVYCLVAGLVISSVSSSNVSTVNAQNVCEAHVEFICNPDPNRFNVCADVPSFCKDTSEGMSDTGSAQQSTTSNQQPFKAIIIKEINLAFSYPSSWESLTNHNDWISFLPEGGETPVLVGIGRKVVEDIQSISPAVLERFASLVLTNGENDPDLQLTGTTERQVSSDVIDRYFSVKANSIDSLTGKVTSAEFHFIFAGNILYMIEFVAPKSEWEHYLLIFNDFTKRVRFGRPVSDAQNIIDEQSEIDKAILEYKKNTMITNMRVCAVNSIIYYNPGC